MYVLFLMTSFSIAQSATEKCSGEQVSDIVGVGECTGGDEDNCQVVNLGSTFRNPRGKSYYLAQFLTVTMNVNKTCWIENPDGSIINESLRVVKLLKSETREYDDKYSCPVAYQACITERKAILDQLKSKSGKSY